ncbi:RNA-binding protein 10 isoform X4 [Cucumis melo var. makuwa]|uniref:RNA-binding protein 10 isoform X4 n=1 Tax=Cucumis melo var. makuwa TaxID=1194695 RepID=A0A5A7SM61_CUCMM|nr:RNA-binding protein 10 isoform X4 [Cucumis melo var. makuwa]
MDCWSLSLPLDDEFKKLVNRMNPHRVTIDNDSIRKATPIKVFFFLLQLLFIPSIPNSAEFRRKLSAVISPFVASASSRKPLQSSDTNTSTSSFCAITGNKSSYPSSTLLEAEWGPLRHVRVIKERNSGISRGFAFIDFPSVGAAQTMMDKIGDDGLVVDGRKLFFEYSSKPTGGAGGSFAAENTTRSGHFSKNMTMPSDWMCTIFVVIEILQLCFWCTGCVLGWKGIIGSLEGLKVMEMSFESWFSKGLAHVDYMLNHFLEAIAVVKQALDVDPTNLEMLHALGVSHANGVVELLFITILRGYDVCISKRLWQGGNTAGPGVGDITKQMTAIEEMVASEYN